MRNPESAYALRAEGIGKSFGRVEVLKSASMWGESGKVTTLLGRTGAGKTTLMKIAAGVLRPDYGVISLFGDVRENQSLPRLARSGLMFVPQTQLVSPAYRVRDHLRALAATFGSEGIAEAILLSCRSLFSDRLEIRHPSGEIGLHEGDALVEGKEAPILNDRAADLVVARGELSERHLFPRL